MSCDSAAMRCWQWSVVLSELSLSLCETSSPDANISRRLLSSNESSSPFITVLWLELIGVLAEAFVTFLDVRDFARFVYLLRFRLAFFSARLIFFDLRCTRAGRAGLVMDDPFSLEAAGGPFSGAGFLWPQVSDWLWGLVETPTGDKKPVTRVCDRTMLVTAGISQSGTVSHTSILSS